MTITEALAEIKTIAARLGSKRVFIVTHSVRPRAFVDALEGQGGSEKVLKEEMQSYKDLCERWVALRTAIQMANQATPLTIGKRTRTITEWLAWRREVVQPTQALQRELRLHFTQAESSAARVVSQDANVAGVIVHVDQQALAQAEEETVAILGELDGQLSVKNAVTQIAA